MSENESIIKRNVNQIEYRNQNMKSLAKVKLFLLRSAHFNHIAISFNLRLNVATTRPNVGEGVNFGPICGQIRVIYRSGD